MACRVTRQPTVFPILKIYVLWGSEGALCVPSAIVNRDGTRYSKKGEYRTHQEDIDASNNIDVDVSSGSSSEKSTSEGYIFHTSLPTEHAAGDEDESYFTRSTPSTSKEKGIAVFFRQQLFGKCQWPSWVMHTQVFSAIPRHRGSGPCASLCALSPAFHISSIFASVPLSLG